MYDIAATTKTGSRQCLLTQDRDNGSEETKTTWHKNCRNKVKKKVINEYFWGLVATLSGISMEDVKQRIADK